MAKELKDEDVAEALGYCKEDFELGEDPNTHQIIYGNPPKYTTSLDAITQQIERRGSKCKSWCIKLFEDTLEFNDPFDPKQWCGALMAYLEEKE